MIKTVTRSSSSSSSSSGRSVVGKENRGIKNVSTEYCEGNIVLYIVRKRRVLLMWENYITEFYERRNRLENLEVEPAGEVDEDEKGSHYY
jgi:hypothetical protein